MPVARILLVDLAGARAVLHGVDFRILYALSVDEQTRRSL